MIKMVIFISGRGSNMEALIRATQEGILKGIAEPVLVFSNQPEALGLP
jgi:phosphoribosylglycinamide formyltransferase-1